MLLFLFMKNLLAQCVAKFVDFDVFLGVGRYGNITCCISESNNIDDDNEEHE